MKEGAVRYVCSECGHVEAKWTGRCPECGSWNTFSEEKVIPKQKGKADPSPVIDESVRKLSEIPYEKAMRVSSGIDELDRVLGGGVMRPSSVLVGGEPGIGKSTIMEQMLSNLSDASDVLYVSGEESPSQVRLRAERLGLRSDRISVFCDTRLEALLDIIERIRPGYIVIDSLQTLYSASVASLAGSPNQVRACCMELSLLAKRIGAAIFFIGHVTKDGNIAGPKIVEHMVDTVLYFESAESGMRLLRASKNRFGSVDEIGLDQRVCSHLRRIVVVLIVGHVAGLNIRKHAVEHRSKFKLTVLAGYCILIVDVSLDIRIIHQEIENLISGFFVLAFCGYCEQQVNT